MRWHHRLYVALRGWFRSTELDRELGEELQFHLDRQVQANLDAGMTPEQARRSAALTVGHADAIHEVSRDQRAGNLVRQLGRDLAYGMRLLRKAPSFAVTAIAIVALGIGSVTAIFSVVYGVALKPLPFHEPDRLVNIWTVSSQLGTGRYLVDGADQRDWQASNHVFEDIALLRNVANFNLVDGSGEPERLLAARVSANLLPVLGVSPAHGRGFTEEEDEIGRDQVVLLSDAFWRRRFAADPSLVGRSINLSGVPHTVVGIMGPDFQYPGREFQIWTPLTINPAELARKVTGSNLNAVARLKPGVSVAQAQSEMDTIAARLARTYATNEERGVLVVPMHEDLLGNVQSALYVMLGAVLCLLLVAALNLSTLLSARAAARSRELAVRLAMGATRGRVVLQSIAEIVPILVIGGAAGVAVATFAIRAFLPFAPASLPRAENIEVNTAVLVAAIVILSLTGLLAVLLPASQAWQSDLAAATRDEGRSAAGSVRQTRARSALVVAQIALALPLLIGGALLSRTFTTLTATNPGFHADNVLTLHLAIPRSKYRSDALVAQVVERIDERMKSVPGVTAAGMVNRLPLAGGAQVFTMEFDSPVQRDDELSTVDSRTATPGYFKAMGIPIIEGRTFDSRDTADAPQVGLVDERLARQLWPGESAVGKHFRIPAVLNNGVPLPWIEIVGVVGHVKHDGLDLDTRAQVYWPNAQRAQDRMVLTIRAAAGNVAGLTPSVVRAIRDIDPDQPVYDVRTMSDVVARSLGQRWLNAALVGTFATVALTLCAIGVYGVIAFGVTRQRREFGIRLALGASRGGIARQVVNRGLALAGLGVTAGLAIALALARSIAALLHGVPATDAVSFAGAAATFLAVAVLASYLPARRAAAVDPAVTLRGE